MDLEWTTEEHAFGAELRASVDAHGRPGWTHRQGDTLEPEDIDAVRVFCAAIGEAGLLTRNWPAEYAGGVPSRWERSRVSRELSAAVGGSGPQYVNVN